MIGEYFRPPPRTHENLFRNQRNGALQIAHEHPQIDDRNVFVITVDSAALLVGFRDADAISGNPFRPQK